MSPPLPFYEDSTFGGISLMGNHEYVCSAFFCWVKGGRMAHLAICAFLIFFGSGLIEGRHTRGTCHS